MLIAETNAEMAGVTPCNATDSVEQIVDLMLSVLSDGLDHPELWKIVPDFVVGQPMLVTVLQQRLERVWERDANISLQLLLGVCAAALGDPREIIEVLTPLAIDHSQSPLVQGALFYLHGLADPGNPKYAQSRLVPDGH